MRRAVTGGAGLAVVALLAATACSGGSPSPGDPIAAPSASGSRPAVPGASAEPSAPASRSPRPAPSWRFTVEGSTPVPPNGSQDTRAEAESACDSARFAHDKTVGAQVAAGFAAAGLTITVPFSENPSPRAQAVDAGETAGVLPKDRTPDGLPQVQPPTIRSVLRV